MCRKELRALVPILDLRAPLCDAARRPQRILQLNRKKGIDDPGMHHILRLSVEPGGCSGFSYKFELEEQTKLEPEDMIFEQSGARVVVDEFSLGLLTGATIDFEDEVRAPTRAWGLAPLLAAMRFSAPLLAAQRRGVSCAQMMKSAFVVADNPQSDSGCGCGSSFNPKDLF